VVRTEFWRSRRGFILASIGAAIGIGNVWRFPYLCYTHGGGAFFIPYLIALFTAGIPLLILEFSLGYRTKAGAPLAFRKLLGARFEWIGWLVVMVGFATMIYYTVILAWAADYTIFSASLAYAGNTEVFFFDGFLQTTGHLSPLGNPDMMIVGGLVLVWAWIFAAIIRGVRSVEKMVWVTVTLPWLLIAVFVLRGLTLPGAMDGIAYYLTPDFSVLTSPDVWLAAYGQIFFTLSLGWGVMITYASFLPEGSDIAENAFIIAIANTLTSFAAGIAVFSTLGYLAHEAGVPVPEVVKGGIELAFVAYPAAIQVLPFAPHLFGILFFVMFITLGIDSAFSTIEATTVPLIEQFRKPRWVVTTIVCLAGFAAGLLFTTPAGYYWLDIADHYLSVILLVLVGILEAAAVAYFYDLRLMRRFINDCSNIRVGKWWEFSIRYLIPVVLVIAFILGIYGAVVEPYGGYPGWANLIGWALVIALPVMSIWLARVVQTRSPPP